MKVLEYHQTPCPALWRAQIARSEWPAAAFLGRTLDAGRFFAEFGEKSRLLLLTEGEQLLAFCAYLEREAVGDRTLTPWAGFVYTFPEQRGKRRQGKLLEHVYALAKAEGRKWVYICTREEGLYEKYGCRFWKTVREPNGVKSAIYRMEITEKDYSDVLGRRVRCTVDRPLGSAHPRHPEMIYPVNYGYVEGVTAGDGAWQDVYILGVDRPLRACEGVVVAVLRRLNDCEDKWIVSPDGRRFSDAEILEATAFTEQYFMVEPYGI